VSIPHYHVVSSDISHIHTHTRAHHKYLTTACSIDILASKLVFNNQGYDYSSRSRHRGHQYNQHVTVSRYDNEYAGNNAGHIVTIQGGAGKTTMRRTSSEEQIVDRSAGATPTEIGLEAMDPRRIGVSKTVEVEIHKI
jgi:hypothetical protein